jgi:hypothetical protein
MGRSEVKGEKTPVGVFGGHERSPMPKAIASLAAISRVSSRPAPPQQTDRSIRCISGHRHRLPLAAHQCLDGRQARAAFGAAAQPGLQRCEPGIGIAGQPGQRGCDGVFAAAASRASTARPTHHRPSGRPAGCRRPPAAGCGNAPCRRRRSAGPGPRRAAVRLRWPRAIRHRPASRMPRAAARRPGRAARGRKAASWRRAACPSAGAAARAPPAPCRPAARPRRPVPTAARRLPRAPRRASVRAGATAGSLPTASAR